MPYTSYRELEDAVFNKIKDLTFLELPEDTAYEIVHSYMRPAIVQFQSAKQDLSDRNDKLARFNFELTDETFTILVNYMVIEWLDSNYLLTTNALKTRLTSSDFKSLNLSQQLDKVMTLRTMLKSENDQLAINRSYHTSTLFDIVTGRKKVQS